jgi:DNA-directed RNA polymerase specialized sigma24 family protein
MNNPKIASTAAFGATRAKRARRQASRPLRSPLTQTDICRAFNAALLLTGSTILAEATVLNANEALDVDNIRPESLLAEVTRVSVRFQTDWCDQQPNRITHPQPQLPVELQNVLKLPTELRHAFVLRTLLGMSPEASARILQLEPSQVAAHLLAAGQALAARNEPPTFQEWFWPAAGAC